MDYIVEPMSRKELRALSDLLRCRLGIENRIRVPIVELLDLLSEKFEKFNYEIVEDDDLPKNVHADTDVRTGHIRIKTSVYERACKGRGRDRMTIAHEIAHFFTLCFCEFKLQRNFNNDEVLPYNDPEWHAKCFAGEFMVPYQLTQGMTPTEIADACGVSYQAAKYQYDHRN